MKLRTVTALCVLLSLIAGAEGRHGRGAPANAIFMPAVNNVATNWQKAGLLGVGGYPSRTTQCGATVSPIGGGTSDATNIQNAINACTSGQYVQLAVGAFSMKTTDTINIAKSITLRGGDSCPGTSTPYCGTTLTMTDGAMGSNGTTYGTTCGTQSACDNNNAPGIILGINDYFYWSGCNYQTNVCAAAIPLAADVVQGATSVQLTSTSVFSVGMWVLIDEASGAGKVTDPIQTGSNTVWAASDFLNSSSSPATGRVEWNLHFPAQGFDDFDSGTYPYETTTTGCYFSFCDRPTSEIHLITAIGAGPCPGTNCTLTFDDPLTIGYRVAGGVSFTGTLTSGSKTLTVVSGTPVVGQIISGPGLPQSDYLTALTGSTGTLNIAATANETAVSMDTGDHQARVSIPTNSSGTYGALPSYAGVENMTINRTDGGAVLIEKCAYCWVKNVEMYHWRAGAVNLEYAVRAQVDTIYAHDCADPENSGVEYPIDLQFSSTEIYVVNSITRLCGKPITIRSAGAGSVVAYNWLDQTFYGQCCTGAGLEDTWVETGVQGSHATGSHHVLFEGNMGANLQNDSTHGPPIYHTYFRNWGTGFRYGSFQDATGSPAITIDDLTNVPGGSQNANGPLIASGTWLYQYWMAYVGNVLGTSGQTTTAKGWIYELTANWDGGSIYAMWTDGWNPLSGTDKPDKNLVGAGMYQFRSGNYDYVNSSIVDWAAGYSQSLPSSLYLTSTPAFFSAGASCTYPWPWITPASSPYVQTNSCSSSGLPALARWLAGTPFVQP
jgi:hypothetical protein